jgi:hypothetical protein
MIPAKPVGLVIEAEIGFQQISEVKSVAGIDLLEPLSKCSITFGAIILIALSVDEICPMPSPAPFLIKSGRRSPRSSTHPSRTYLLS